MLAVIQQAVAVVGAIITMAAQSVLFVLAYFISPGQRVFVGWLATSLAIAVVVYWVTGWNRQRAAPPPLV